MTPTLFQLPEPEETKLELAKREHHIWTDYCAHYEEPSERWMAVKFENAQELAQAMEYISRYCVRYDEAGLMATGETEADAVIAVARKQNIALTL